MKHGYPLQIISLLATTSLVAMSLSGCMASQESGEEARIFAPRLLAIPPCKRIRVEVAEWDMQGNSEVQNNDRYHQLKEADVSQNQLTLDGIPWGKAMYFRVSGIDTTSTIVWSSHGGVPDDAQPRVTIGTGGYQPRTVGVPSIQSSPDPLSPKLQCGTSNTGATWPAWTTDGTTASEKNTDPRIDRTMSQVVVTLASGQKLSARCTDGHNWSAPVAYQAPTGPSALPSQAGPGSDFTLSPTIFVPSGSAGTITFSANTALFGGFSNWKLAYRVNNTGSWIVQDLTASTGASFNGTGTIDAYLIAWNGSKWVAGSASTATYPTGPTALPTQTGPGSDFALSPSIVVPSSPEGTITFSASTVSYPEYSNWKLAYRMNNIGSWNVQELSAATGVSYSGTGAIDAYLIAWNGTKWVTGSARTATYPGGPIGPTALPTQTGPGLDFSLSPMFFVPSSSAGTITFSANTATFPEYSNWKLAYRMNNIDSWNVQELTAATGVSFNGTGTIDAYLIAWNGSKWITGSASTTTYPSGPIGPTALPTQTGPGTDFTLYPSILVPSGSAGTITFSANTASFSDHSNWNLVYRMNNTGSWFVQELTAANGVSFDGTGTIDAYLVAWNGNQAKWVTGPSATKNFGPSPTYVDIVASGGPLPSVVVHGTSFLPGICTFSFAATSAMATSYSHWKVVYQLPGNANWVAIDTGETVPFNVSGHVSAYLQAWSISNQQWVSGPVNSLYVPAILVVDPPVFKDANGNKLDSIWEQDGTTISLQIAGTGTIYYTTNYSYPMPDMPGTSIWDPTQKLTFPLDISTLTIKALAKSEGISSDPANLVIKRPLWTRQDNSEAGCVQSDGRLLAACGDATGPWRWDTTANKWNPLDPMWQVGQAQQLLLTTKFVFATTGTGGVHRLDRIAAAGRFVELDSRTRPANLGGLAVVRDTLWASTASGPCFFDAVADTWAAPALPAETIFNPKEGPAWSSGGLLWMAFGPELWRYGPTTDGPTAWERWNSTYPSISWLGPDPFSTASFAMSYGSVFGQIGPGKMIASTNYLSNTNGNSIVQIASHGGNAYAATDNGAGSGGVVRANGWSAQYWSSTEREWPSISNRSVSSQGVAVFSARGTNWLLATTPQGTYTLKLK